MVRTIKIRKGFDIPLDGAAEKKIAGECQSSFFGIRPSDFPGLIPKLAVRPGDQVSAGSALFADKKNPEVKFTSPVSGNVVSVQRGDRRKILEVVVEKKDNQQIDFGKNDLSGLSKEKITELLLASGLWPSIRQRPYNIIAKPGDAPKSVFISGFDTSPLAPDNDFVAGNSRMSLFNKGISALSKLTGVRINLVLNGKTQKNDLFTGLPEIDISYFSGPHPAGNVGVHIHHLDPLNKGEVVWHVNFQDVFTIGRLFDEGVYRPERIVALTGSEVIDPKYYKMLSGASVAPVVKDNVRPGNHRYISGNVLTGTKIKNDGYLGYYDSQITVIPEGNYHEFFGWASPGIKKFSFSKTFLSSLFPQKSYRFDTNLHGGERAFVVTGLYEKVVPMDIYPMQLFKAILAGDIEMMENLGIYEVAEEDFALCEYVCPSKTEIQSIIRKGIELMIKEMS